MNIPASLRISFALSVGIVASLSPERLARADGATAFAEPPSSSTSVGVAPAAAPEEPPPPAPRRHGEFGRDPSRLALSFGAEAGIGYLTEGGPQGTAKGIGRALAPGPHFGLRASFEILPWFAIDGRGVFTNNAGNDLVSSGSLSTVGGFGAARFTLPFWRIRPYALLGFGGYSIDASGSSTQLTSSTVSAFEIGVGALIPVSRHLDVGVEYLYTQLNSEVLSTNENADGGDPNAFSLFAQYRFEL